MQTATPVTSVRTWPADPYKGLTYYGPEDVPLFAGRNMDAARVARLLNDGVTRVLLLHGPTGCGKSSFLRAALIPFLENQIGRFRFAKERGPADDATLFVRATHDPLVELASKVWEYAREHEEPLVSDSPMSSTLEANTNTESAASERYARGPIIDLEKYSTLAKFTSAVSDDPERLVDVMGRITYRRSRTQALVVDQAEEVLTLRPGRDGDDARRRFFMFLTYLSLSDINFRLLIAFRTEYHGRFYAALKSAGIDARSVEDYFLAELTGHDLVDAITRPTSTEPVGDWGVPREHYRFYYEAGLELQIAKELQRTQLGGGTLPVLQIVCRRLYKKAIASPKVDRYWVIKSTDYRNLGGIQGQVNSHLQEALEMSCAALSPSKLLVSHLESMRWRDVLAALAKPQADGTVTTDVKTATTLSELAELRSCQLPFAPMMDFLGKEEWKIVRPVELRRPTGEKVACYSLGHDVLGGVLEEWKNSRDTDRRGVRHMLLLWGIYFIVVSLAIVSPAFAGLLPRGLNDALLQFRIALLAVGVSCLAFAAIPDNRAFRFLYRPVYGFITNLWGVRRLPSTQTASG